MHEKVIFVFSNVFGIESAEINETISVESVENWDSIAHMRLILSLEEEFNISFDDNEIPNLTSFKKIVDILNSKLS